jgi:hypothetical protein
MSLDHKARQEAQRPKEGRDIPEGKKQESDTQALASEMQEAARGVIVELEKLKGEEAEKKMKAFEDLMMKYEEQIKALDAETLGILKVAMDMIKDRREKVKEKPEDDIESCRKRMEEVAQKIEKYAFQSDRDNRMADRLRSRVNAFLKSAEDERDTERQGIIDLADAEIAKAKTQYEKERGWETKKWDALQENKNTWTTMKEGKTGFLYKKSTDGNIYAYCPAQGPNSLQVLSNKDTLQWTYVTDQKTKDDVMKGQPKDDQAMIDKQEEERLKDLYKSLDIKGPLEILSGKSIKDPPTFSPTCSNNVVKFTSIISDTRLMSEASFTMPLLGKSTGPATYPSPAEMAYRLAYIHVNGHPMIDGDQEAKLAYLRRSEGMMHSDWGGSCAEGDFTLDKNRKASMGGKRIDIKSKTWQLTDDENVDALPVPKQEKQDKGAEQINIIYEMAKYRRTDNISVGYRAGKGEKVKQLCQELGLTFVSQLDFKDGSGSFAMRRSRILREADLRTFEGHADKIAWVQPAGVSYIGGNRPPEAIAIDEFIQNAEKLQSATEQSNNALTEATAERNALQTFKIPEGYDTVRKDIAQRLEELGKIIDEKKQSGREEEPKKEEPKKEEPKKEEPKKEEPKKEDVDEVRESLKWKSKYTDGVLDELKKTYAPTTTIAGWQIIERLHNNATWGVDREVNAIGKAQKDFPQHFGSDQDERLTFLTVQSGFLKKLGTQIQEGLKPYKDFLLFSETYSLNMRPYSLSINRQVFEDIRNGADIKQIREGMLNVTEAINALEPEERLALQKVSSLELLSKDKDAKKYSSRLPLNVTQSQQDIRKMFGQYMKRVLFANNALTRVSSSRKIRNIVVDLDENIEADSAKKMGDRLSAIVGKLPEDFRHRLANSSILIMSGQGIHSCTFTQAISGGVYGVTIYMGDSDDNIEKFLQNELSPSK